MKWLIDRYAALLDRHHRVVTGFVLVVTIVLTVSVLRLKTDDRLMRALRTEDPKASAEERAFVEQTEHTCLVILSGDEVFSAHGIALVRSLDERLAEIEGVADVDSLNDVHTVRQLGRRRNFLMLLPAADADAERIAQAKERAADHPFTVGQLMTADGRVTSLAVTLNPEITDTASLRPIIKQIKQSVQAAIEGTSFECKFTGMPVIQVQNSEVVVADQVIFNVVGSLAGFLVNCLLLRRLAAVAIVSAGSWLGVFWTFGLFGLVGQPLSPVNGIVAPLAMTIGLTDSIHLLLDIRRMQERGLSRRAAVVAAVRDVGLACTLTTATTIVGFLSLGAAELEILRNLGICCAMAVTCAYFSVLTVVPLLSMTWLGDRILVPTSAQSKQ
ncbi:MAG: MMPL family transporter, partial [Planctomycetota bacterium]